MPVSLKDVVEGKEKLPGSPCLIAPGTLIVNRKDRWTFNVWKGPISNAPNVSDMLGNTNFGLVIQIATTTNNSWPFVEALVLTELGLGWIHVNDVIAI